VGFRRSHRQAGDAYLVALRHPQPVTLYADVALEALALRDEQVARDFAAGQLRGLNGDDKLRDTLRRYFASSQNAAATAVALGVHEQTVARRLKAVEEKIGCPLNHRRAELELALRLEELLANPPAPH
jgi:DNA-binding PucR family transcriptional regulator